MTFFQTNITDYFEVVDKSGRITLNRVDRHLDRLEDLYSELLELYRKNNISYNQVRPIRNDIELAHAYWSDVYEDLVKYEPLHRLNRIVRV